MSRSTFCLLAAVLVCGCSAEPRIVGMLKTDIATGTATTGLRLGEGYRGANDPCVRVGASEFTAPMLRPDEDLVGCPLDFDGRTAFIKANHATEATRTEDWVLYSVPLLGDAPVDVPLPGPVMGGANTPTIPAS